MTPATRSSGLDWLHAIAQPELTRSWNLAQWERVARLARRLRLFGRLAESMQAAGLQDSPPLPVQRHLLAELRQSRWRLTLLKWTIEQVGLVLRDAKHPCVLLKGAAYVAQGLPIAAGRLPSDLDILVPRSAIAATLRLLKDHDWWETELDTHDQRYYHEWSHEVPPMRHRQLGMELDLHHNILPPVARTHVDARLLFERLQPSGLPVWQVLGHHDQVLHSAAHLLLDSELRDRMRDLVDLDGMLRHFAAANPGFWPGLIDRSLQTGLQGPLATACLLLAKWLGTPIPQPSLEQMARLGPGRAKRLWLMPLLQTALTPTEPDALPSPSQTLAASALLVRHHWQRLPLKLLIPHVWHKIHKGSRIDSEG